MNRRLYAIHRWLSAIAFAQLAIWSISGFVFAVLPNDRVRGRSVPGVHDVAIDHLDGIISATEARARATKLLGSAPSRLELRQSLRGVVWIARHRDDVVRLDGATGEKLPVTEQEAIDIARRDQPDAPNVISVHSITGETPIEYRERPMPAWRVLVDDKAGTAVYVDQRTGEVTARRTSVWRVYDVLWSLHIMDYRRRDDIHGPLLVGAGALAIVTVSSGVVLWGVRIARRLRRGERRR